MTHTPYAIKDDEQYNSVIKHFCIEGVHVYQVDGPTLNDEGELVEGPPHWFLNGPCNGSCKNQPVEIPEEFLARIRAAAAQAL